MSTRSLIPHGYKRVVTDEEVGTLTTCATPWGAARVRDKYQRPDRPCEYRVVRRGLRWHVVAYQARLLPVDKVA